MNKVYGAFAALMIGALGCCVVLGCSESVSNFGEGFEQGTGNFALTLGDDVQSDAGAPTNGEASSEIELPSELGSAPQPITPASEETLAMLEQRIDVEGSALSLVVDLKAPLPSVAEQEADVEALLLDVEFLAEESWSPGSLNAQHTVLIGDKSSEDGYYVAIDKTTGRYVVKNSEIPEPGVADAISDSEYWGLTTPHLADIGVSLGQTETRIMTVARQSAVAEDLKLYGKDAITVDYLAKDVYVYRSIGGIRVRGSRLRFQFFLDGRLRKIIGRWQKINMTKVQLTSDFESEDAVLEAVAQKLAAEGVDPALGKNIRLHTTYSLVPTDDAGVYGLDMRLEISAPGPIDGDSPQAFEMDI